jgi:peptide subunit release factor 1 (eRF1)
MSAGSGSVATPEHDISVPSLTISTRDRYTPEFRDRILGKLAAAMRPNEYSLLIPAELRALAEIRSADSLILSLYLQLTPDQRASSAWRTLFHSLTTESLKGIEDRRRREKIKEEVDRIGQALEAGLPVLGRGVAFFSCAAIGLWRKVALPLELPNGMHLAAYPYLRPLVRTRDEHDRFGLTILSQEHSRFFVSQIGQVEEVLQIKGPSLRKALADKVARTNRETIPLEAVRNEARLLAHAAELVMARFEARYLLVAGPANLTTALIDHLPKELQQRTSDDWSVFHEAEIKEVAATAEPVQRAIEAREELATIERMIEAGPWGAAWGEEAVFEALELRRVRTLAVEEGFAIPGNLCPVCGRLQGRGRTECITCGNPRLTAVDDAVEIAIEQALQQDASFELVRSGPVRQRMLQRAPIGAMLRW